VVRYFRDYLLSPLEHVLRRVPKQRYEARDLILLIATTEQRQASVHLNQYAPKAPHVNGCAVRQTKNDLWGSVEARLDVRVEGLAGAT